MTDKLQLPVIDKDVLVFEVDTVKKLREIGILGNFIGSLSFVPQQNNFMGLPLKLTKYEVWWLVEQNLAILVNNEKLLKLNNKGDGFYVTDHTNTLKSQLDLEQERDHLQLLERFEYLSNDNSYRIFKELRNKGYYILPGLKFGGEFIVYPGDPIRYHSHYIVNAISEINMLHLVVSGRLASGVKKLYVISEPKEPEPEPKETESQEPEPTDPESNESESEQNENLVFSVEWAGFG